ncbi:phosphatidylserine/phosphatidylglycerophosphate/cardiolipin synthase-like enzyme [Caldalkalibacillus uzonensis]|uniref:Phosphatidylserine/phosphatidylglycerophosphate/ cardiolipin synthase-like enzyme n=1 Tax=Caldalkalibacillus uzonensis TaxID=353224 RepID=A0ABU0CRK9_9BACI|nr:phosphatidylserine/phosphatidylglycerophosphate/cardiolipin synthase-like enzyme [Caldalkalibacillus uzonensis]
MGQRKIFVNNLCLLINGCTITWLIVLAVFPVVGILFYFLFGRNFRRRRMFKEKAKADADEIMHLKRFTPHSLLALEGVPAHQYRFFQLAHRISNAPISFQSKTEVLTDGEETFQSLLAALRQAKHHIHLEYYIVRDDDLGQRVKHILIKKAKEGVEVRFLYDSVGCWKLSQRYIDELKQAG